jgi:hypothetical protein
MEKWRGNMASKHLFYLALCLTLLPTIVEAQNQDDQSTEHSMSQTEKAGPYLIRNDLTDSQRTHLLGEIRSFLWTHWKKHHSGELKATFYTVEGDQTNYAFFIEKDRRGRWVVRLKTESEVSELLPPGQVPRREDTLVVYSIVERIDPATEKPVSADQVLQPEIYKLRLNSQGGSSSFTI